MKFNIERLQKISQLTRNLAVGLRNITFGDNFNSFETTVTIGAGLETRIRNPLTLQPTRYIIVSQKGNGLITKSGTWSNEHVYLTNNGAVEVTATIIFFE